MDDTAVTSRQDEGELARRIAAAAPDLDPEAEAELCRRLAPRIRRYGLRHLRDAEAASDLMQNVLLMTLEKLRAGAVRDPDQLVSFVFGTCRLSVLDYRRGEQRRTVLLLKFGDDLPVADIAPAPRLDHDRIELCLDTLTERERAVLVMSFYEDKSAVEVGSLLGLEQGNVRVIRHRAMERLRECVLGKDYCR